MMTKTRPYWQIEKTAENLLTLHSSINNPAENIDCIIEDCKLELIPLDMNDDSFLGLFGVDKSEGKKFIAFNKNIMKERILFTKAHELGHYVLGHELVADICKEMTANEKNPQETEANVFASALLMPKDLFKADFITLMAENVGYKEKLFSAYNNLNYSQQRQILMILKNKFYTSFEAINYRIKNLFEGEEL